MSRVDNVDLRRVAHPVYGTGKSFGPIWWDYDLTLAAAYTLDVGYRLRWFGIVLPWFAVGITYKRPMRR